jgi:hypothetical protein
VAPVYLATREPETRDRVSVGLRLLVALPQYIVLLFVDVAALLMLVLGWFGALVTGRLPDFARDFLTGVLRWQARVEAYVLLLTDQYPPYSMQPEEAYPVQIAVPPATELNRLAVLVRLVLLIPAAIAASVLSTGAFVISIASWLSIMLTGSMPTPLYEAARAALRFQLRYWAYVSMLTTDYPAGVMGDPGPAGAVDEQWMVRLSPQGRTAMILLIVIGLVVQVLTGRR